jgi:hypothetical protein
MKLISNDGSYMKLQRANGATFIGTIGSCGEAIYLKDADGNAITTIPTDRTNRITDTDARLAGKVLNQILSEAEAKVAAEKAAELAALDQAAGDKFVANLRKLVVTTVTTYELVDAE